MLLISTDFAKEADGVLRTAHFAPYVEGLVQFGFPAHLATPIGLTLTLCTLLHLIPRTAVVGAIYDPTRKELFTAERGQGAWLNGVPLRWSDLNQAWVPTWPCPTSC